MKWYTEEPPKDIPILCCFKTYDKSSFDYYVCQRESWYEEAYNEIWLTEAYGEQYARWPISALVAWTTFEELQKNMLEKIPHLIFY